MKLLKCFPLLIFLILNIPNANSQIIDSSKQFEKNNNTDSATIANIPDDYATDDEFNLFLMAFAAVGIGIMLICIGVGIALTVIALFAVFGLVSTGILSTSIIIGLNKRSFSKGFKTLIILSASVFGMLLGGIGFFVVNKVYHWWSTGFSILSGSLWGLVAGAFLGFLSLYIFRRLIIFFKERLT